MTVDDPREEQPPVLRISKDAAQEPQFHYNREQRLGRPDAPYGRTRMGPMGLGVIFRKGRGWSIPFFVIVMGLLFAGPLLTRATNQARLTGCDVRLSAERSGDAILASVVATATGKPLEPRPAGLIQVRFLAPDTGAAASTSAVLEGGTATLRVRLPATGTERRIDAEVVIDGKSARLSTAVAKASP